MTLGASVNALHTATPFFTGATAATIKVAVTPGQVQTSSTSRPAATTWRMRSPRCAAAPPTALRGAHRAGGERRAECQDNQTNSQAVLSAVGNQRQSVSGVSLDEEMTNLISFQRGYQASARTLTAMDRNAGNAHQPHRRRGCRS